MFEQQQRGHAAAVPPHSHDGDGYAPGKEMTMGLHSRSLGATSILIGKIATEAGEAAPLEDSDAIKLSAILRFILGLFLDNDDDAIVGLWDFDEGVAGGPLPSFLTGVEGGGGGGFAVAHASPRMPVVAVERLFFDFVIVSLSLRILWVLLSVRKMGRIISTKNNHLSTKLQTKEKGWLTRTTRGVGYEDGGRGSGVVMLTL
jgi:hypothetical protein